MRASGAHASGGFVIRDTRLTGILPHFYNPMKAAENT
jgi:hypothetical protein